jgi:hypothetical protein
MIRARASARGRMLPFQRGALLQPDQSKALPIAVLQARHGDEGKAVGCRIPAALLSEHLLLAALAP